MREGMSCSSLGGQRTIGLGRCGLEGVPIQERRRGGTGTHRAGRHLQKNAISLGVKEEWKWNGRKQGGRFGPGGRKSHGTHRHDNARQGGRRTKKGLGLRKGTLALGTSGTRGTLKGTLGADGSMALWRTGVGSVHGGLTTAGPFEGGCDARGNIHAETPDGAATSNAVVP